MEIKYLYLTHKERNINSFKKQYQSNLSTRKREEFLTIL